MYVVTFSNMKRVLTENHSLRDTQTRTREHNVWRQWWRETAYTNAHIHAHVTDTHKTCFAQHPLRKHHKIETRTLEFKWGCEVGDGRCQQSPAAQIDEGQRRANNNRNHDKVSETNTTKRKHRSLLKVLLLGGGVGVVSDELRAIWRTMQRTPEQCLRFRHHSHPIASTEGRAPTR
jgi:hypothetical protein